MPNMPPRSVSRTLQTFMASIFGIGITVGEVPRMFWDYSEDLWEHLRVNLAQAGRIEEDQ